jgi:hypothetical protein
MLVDRRYVLRSAFALVPGMAGAYGQSAASDKQLFSPVAFGARADGVSDDSIPVQRASDAARSASGTLWIPAGHVFGISRNILVRNGVKSVEGSGTLKILPAAAGPCAIIAAGRVSGNAQNVRDCVFRDFTFDANGKHSLGLYFQNAQRCGAVNIRIVNATGLGVGILFKSFSAGGEPGLGNYAKSCIVEGDIARQPRGSVGIAFESEASFGTAGNLRTYWKQNDRSPQPALSEQQGAVIDCEVLGCYYGLSLGAAIGVHVSGFRSRYNMRCISVQNGSSHNVFSDLILRDSISSAFLIGYGSCDNSIERAMSETTRANGEALFQSIIGSKRNRFEHCSTDVTGGAPQYHFYCAVESDDCAFIDCSARGAAVRAYAAVESAWSSHVRHRSHHAIGFGTLLDNFAHTGMSGVEIENLVIDGSSAVPGIFIAEIADSRGRYPLKNLRISSNSVRGRGFSVPIEIFTMGKADSPGGVLAAELR